MVFPLSPPKHEQDPFQSAQGIFPLIIYGDKNQDVHAEFEPSKSTLDSRKKSPQLNKGSVLVSAGIELIFFLAAGTVLGFGFSVRILLITR